MPLGVVWVIPSGSRRGVIVRSSRLRHIFNTWYMVGSPSILSAALLSARRWCSLVLWSRTIFALSRCSSARVVSGGGLLQCFLDAFIIIVFQVTMVSRAVSLFFAKERLDPPFAGPLSPHRGSRKGFFVFLAGTTGLKSAILVLSSSVRASILQYAGSLLMGSATVIRRHTAT